MATFKQVTIFHLLLFVINIDLILPLEVDHAFGVPGGQVSFEVMNTYHLSDDNFISLLYRSTKDGNLVLLMNSSNPWDKSAPHLGVRVDYSFRRFSLTNLSVADEGRYITERWRNGILRESRAHDLTICEATLDLTTRNAFWIMKNITVNVGDRLLVYWKAYLLDKINPDIKMLIVNTSLPISDDRAAEVKVFSSNSTIIWNTTRNRSDDYHFLIRSEDHCVAYGQHTTNRGARGPGIATLHSLAKIGERISLPCHPSVEHWEVFTWKTPLKDIYMDRSLPANLTQQHTEAMYVEPSNSSLIIPSVSTKYSGSYTCLTVTIHLFVCTDLEAMHLTFSLGGNVILDFVAEMNGTVDRCNSHLYKAIEPVNHTTGAKDKEGENMYWDSVYKDSRIRASCTKFPQFSLTATNLTANDSGLYRWRAWGKTGKGYSFCFDKKIYLHLEYPFGIHSTFYKVYSALMACGLLGMICAVISVHLKIRGREQHSQETQGRTTEQPGLPMRKMKAKGGRSANDYEGTADDRVLELK